MKNIWRTKYTCKAKTDINYDKRIDWKIMSRFEGLIFSYTETDHYDRRKRKLA